LEFTFVAVALAKLSGGLSRV